MGARLVAAAASGYLLGGCAGDGLEGFSGATELPSVALPEVTVPDVTIPTIPDVAFINLAFPSGTIGHVEIAWLAPSKLRRTAIVGSS